jgi:ubiquinone/menaquinone biosynthesis C-methylase UbiE
VDKEVYRNIIEENIKLHRVEAGYYERLHPEEFNWFEQAETWKDLIFISEHIPKPCPVLDIGCGTGNLFLKLLKLKYEVWGVDLSPDMLTVLKERIPREARDRTMLFCQNIDDFIAQANRRFKFIVMSSVLHHFPDYLQTVKRISGLLEAGGWLYITHEPTQYALSADRFLRKILWQLDNLLYLLLKMGKLPKVGPRNYRISDYHLYHGFQEEAVLSESKNAGLKIIKFCRYSSVMRLGISCWIDTKLLGSKGQFKLILQRP